MRMKQYMAFALAVAMLLSLLAGCSQSDQPTQPTQTSKTDETSAPTEPLLPVRTAEEFAPRLNAALEKAGISIKFVFKEKLEYYEKMRTEAGI